MLTADLAASDVDPVLDQQVENVAQDADAVLAVDFDTHIKGPKNGEWFKCLRAFLVGVSPARFFCGGTQIVVKIM
jgi:hypothetical protein